MKRPFTLTALISLGLIPLTGQAGIFPTNLIIHQKTPACVNISPGGITGPGTGYTIENNCNTNITITSIINSNSFEHSAPPYAIYLFNQDTTPLDQRYPFKDPKGIKSNYIEYEWATDGIDCNHTADINQKCKSITVSTHESLLIFGPQKFQIEGTPDILIIGTSIDNVQEHNPGKPFGHTIEEK